MKNKFEGFILFLILIVLIGGLVFFGYVIYKELINPDKVSSVSTNEFVSEDTGVVVTERTEKRNVGDTLKEIFVPEEKTEITYSTQASDGKFYYEQLTDTQKIIYNGLQENKQNMMSGTYTISYGNKFSKILEQENGSKILGDDYQTAIEAFTHDNAHLFYLDVSKMFLNIETKKRAFSTTYNVYIQPAEGQTYFAKGFSSETQVKQAVQKINDEKNEVVSKLSGSKYNDIKAIHDYLIDNIEYDESNTSIGMYTIYGALIEKKCVCEGYARTFKYLADFAGIECVLMQGTATNSRGVQEKHAWNAVKLAGEWYLIDTTWDDPIISGSGIVMGNVHYRYFLKGTNEFYKDHSPEYEFSKGGHKFSYPTISQKNY